MSSPKNPPSSIPQAVTIAAGKGGVGKTSLASNLSGLAAERGYHVLYVDSDPQGNGGRDLGYYDTDKDDKGEAFFEAVALSRPLRVVKEIRPNLDVICGGPMVESLSRLAWEGTGRNAQTAVRNVLRGVADDYDLIVIDTPPGERFMRESALTAARFAVVPTRTDEASLDGVTRLAEDFARVKEYNPELELLGIAMFGVNPSATAILRTVREHLNAGLGGAAPVFQTVIRYLEAPAVDSRSRGLLVHEYARDVVDTAPKWFEMKGKGKAQPRVSSTAHKLAGDYVDLTVEILSAMAERRATDAPQTMEVAR